MHASKKGKDFVNDLEKKYPNLYLLKQSVLKDCPLISKYIENRNKGWWGDGSVENVIKYCQSYATDVDTSLGRI